MKFAGLLSILAGLALWEVVSRLVVANALFLATLTQMRRPASRWPSFSFSGSGSASDRRC
jgi:hypothetical protein